MHYDALETRSGQERERELMAKLAGQLAHAKASAPFYGELLASVDPHDVTSRGALAALPVTRKSQLVEYQRARPPFGGLASTPTGKLARIFMSPGPIYDPEGRELDFWRTARALFAAGFREGDLPRQPLEQGALALRGVARLEGVVVAGHPSQRLRRR